MYYCQTVSHGNDFTFTPALLYAVTRSFLKLDIVYAVPEMLDALI